MVGRVVLSVHDILKANDIVPTMDAEKSYRLGVERGKSEARRAESRVADLELQLREIKLMAERVLRRG